jgi:hypothetical protein
MPNVCDMLYACYMPVICLVIGGGLGLGYTLFIAHLCNHILRQSGGGTWGTALHTVRGVGSGSRDVDAWTQTSLYAEDRGPPSTDDSGASIKAASVLIPRPKDSDRHVSAYPNGPH